MSNSRRELLKSLAAAATLGSAGGIIPLRAAERAHRLISEERAASPSGGYAPKFFSSRQYETLRALCQQIIPPDQESGGALEAGVPEFIDLLTSENKDLQLQFAGGLMWLDSMCADRFGHAYLQCTPAEQKEILDLIAFRKNSEKNPQLGPGIEFLATLRRFTVDAFFTSKIGLQYLGYIGNTYLSEFPGCPAIPEN